MHAVGLCAIYGHPIGCLWLRKDNFATGRLHSSTSITWMSSSVVSSKRKDGGSNTSGSDNACHICDVSGRNCRSRIGLFSHKSKRHRWDPSSRRLSPNQTTVHAHRMWSKLSHAGNCL